MPRLGPESSEARDVDAALASWQQGDLALGEHVFVHLADPQRPLTDGIEAEADAELVMAESEVRGLVLITQTCDIVRRCTDRPFLEVCPLVELANAARVDEVRKGMRPQYLYVPAVAAQHLVGDLDRTMTVEKSVAAAWVRTPGCATDAQRRAIAQALSRKRARMAFPDDFTEWVHRLAKRIKDKHDKDSDEGRVLANLREIRVEARPEWSAQSVHVVFWFVIDEEGPSENPPSREQIENQVCSWLELLRPAGRFAAVDGVAGSLESMTAADYANSDPLDLDHLSS